MMRRDNPLISSSKVNSNSVTPGIHGPVTGGRSQMEPLISCCDDTEGTAAAATSSKMAAPVVFMLEILKVDSRLILCQLQYENLATSCTRKHTHPKILVLFFRECAEAMQSIHQSNVQRETCSMFLSLDPIPGSHLVSSKNAKGSAVVWMRSVSCHHFENLMQVLTVGLEISRMGCNSCARQQCHHTDFWPQRKTQNPYFSFTNNFDILRRQLLLEYSRESGPAPPPINRDLHIALVCSSRQELASGNKLRKRKSSFTASAYRPPTQPPKWSDWVMS